MSSPAVTGRTDRVARAEHEAAHALVGKLCGFRPLEAGLGDGPGDFGFCTFADRPLNRENLREHLATTLAGYLGDRLLADGEWWRVPLRDYALAREKGYGPDRGHGQDWGDWVRLVARLHNVGSWQEAERFLEAELEAAARDAVALLGHYGHSWRVLAERLVNEETVDLRGWRPSP